MASRRLDRDVLRFNDSSHPLAVLLRNELQRLPEHRTSSRDSPSVHRRHGSHMGVMGHEAERLLARNTTPVEPRHAPERHTYQSSPASAEAQCAQAKQFPN